MAEWVKWHTDALNDPKLMRATRRGVKNLVLLPWLLAFAKRSNDSGALTIDGQPAEPEDIVAALPFNGFTAEDIRQLLTDLVDLGILYCNERTTCYSFVKWERRQGPVSSTPEAVRNRVAAHRKRKNEAQLDLGNEVSNGEVTRQTIEGEGEEELEGEEDLDSGDQGRSKTGESGEIAEGQDQDMRHSPPVTAPEAEVHSHNGKRNGRPTWLTPYGDDWRSRYGGEPPWAMLARHLKPEHDRLGETGLRAAWRRYLVETEAAFVNVPKFISTIGTYTGVKPKTGRRRSVVEQNREVIAAWHPPEGG